VLARARAPVTAVACLITTGSGILLVDMANHPESTVESRALVLGGGGVTGIAWMTGLLFGLEEAGVDALTVDHVVGTSAGSAVAAQVTSGAPLEELFQRQVDSRKQVDELKPDVSYVRLALKVLPALLVRRDPPRFRERIGRMALAARTVEPAARRRVIEARLPSHDWPATRLTLVVIDARSGELTGLDRASGASLVDAVAASCAVPGVWPPVRALGTDYIDGGLSSPDNLAFVEGHDSVLVLSPMGASRSGELAGRLRAEMAPIEAAGGRVRALVPDAAARGAIGRNPLDPDKRAAAAHAGRAQGVREAGMVRELWGVAP
jgi:NTE family protein